MADTDRKHTPLPWETEACDTAGEYCIFHRLDDSNDFGSKKWIVHTYNGLGEEEANIAFIELAVNSHYALRDALRDMQHVLGLIAQNHPEAVAYIDQGVMDRTAAALTE